MVNLKNTEREDFFKNKLCETYNNLEYDKLGDYITKFFKIIDEFSSKGIDIKEKELIKAVGKKDYISYACEISIMYHFLSKYSNFKYEVSNGRDKKNFDFSFSIDILDINIEIKSFSSEKNNSNQSPIKLCLNDDNDDILYRMIKEEYEKNGISDGIVSNNNKKVILDFLKKANSQLPNRKKKSINVVVLCTQDLDQYADILCHFFDSKNAMLYSIQNINTTCKRYKNIDAIVVCNMGYGHINILGIHDRTKKAPINGSDAWDYCLSIPNLPMLFWLRPNDFNDEEQKNISEIFFSHTGYLKKEGPPYYIHIFDLYNKILKSKL
ncbi:hypothetical protein QJU23_00750 [Pasteurella atlantica]|uniref:Uncharacterized protein n=2 Tax=Pasteurellaceae TaxID=712 RepID=A0ACC6HJE3_9PAST|nr:hypothetical protein [Pasteurella atlantica]MDP8050953.1 hypothetical protein [Pasteurella atlantica]MDP8104222.1 hypothetical protein [Pasteurella atlantica]MDP8147609.1 hypothetical protein [Pasteurella atlantica]